LLLEYALARLCSAEKPLHPVSRVAGRVEKGLREAFTAAIEERLAGNALPPGVGQRGVKGKPHLYLERFPPPAPRKPPAAQLAGKLLAALELSKQEGAYPATLDELLPRADPEAKPALLKKAALEEPFRSGALVVRAGKSFALAALAGDGATLAG